MCDRYPHCDHSGPIAPAIAGVVQHCRSMLPNHTCYYLRIGCKGCTFRTGPSLVFNPVAAAIVLKLCTDLSPVEQLERLKASIAAVRLDKER